jgi:hypothetical protein
MKVSFFEPSMISQSSKYYEKNNIKNGSSDFYYIKKYGVATHEVIAPRYEFIGEYNIGLNETYPITNQYFKNVLIKEMFWRVRDDLNLTCWFHQQDGQWIVISYIFWPPEAIF